MLINNKPVILLERLIFLLTWFSKDSLIIINSDKNLSVLSSDGKLTLGYINLETAEIEYV